MRSKPTMPVAENFFGKISAPVYATVAILLSLAAIVGMYFWMKTFAKKEDDNTPKVIPIHSAH